MRLRTAIKMKKIDLIEEKFYRYKNYTTGKIPSNVSDRVLKIWGLKDCETVIIKKKSC